MIMDWKKVGQAVADRAPLLGTLLLGPGTGTAIGGLVASVLGTPATPEAVSEELRKNPEAWLKLQQLEADKQVRLQELAVDQAKSELQASVGNAHDVNATMQAEAASEHWPTYTWRPLLGMAVALNTAASGTMVLMVFLPVMWGSAVAATAVSALPTALGALAAINATVLPVLGIASWFRGKMQADPSVPTVNRG